MSFITIQSVDRNDSLRIERSDSGHRVTASFQGESIANRMVRFADARDFIRTLAEVTRSRNGWAILDGTEDCRLVVEADRSLEHFWLTFHVARYFKIINPKRERSRLSFIKLSGSFPIASESYSNMVCSFAKVFEEPETQVIQPVKCG
jgi:hypothetical protein